MRRQWRLTSYLALQMLDAEIDNRLKIGCGRRSKRARYITLKSL